jgi:F420-dependent methylenetetrahydromethanopterin dehydrogenase
MAGRGWDIEYEVPLSIERALEQWRPDVVVALGPAADLPPTVAGETIRWALPAAMPDSIEAAGQLCDGLDEQVAALVR